jgi:hypothetical protein
MIGQRPEVGEFTGAAARILPLFRRPLRFGGRKDYVDSGSTRCLPSRRATIPHSLPDAGHLSAQARSAGHRRGSPPLFELSPGLSADARTGMYPAAERNRPGSDDAPRSGLPAGVRPGHRQASRSSGIGAPTTLDALLPPCHRAKALRPPRSSLSPCSSVRRREFATSS